MQSHPNRSPRRLYARCNLLLTGALVAALLLSGCSPAVFALEGVLASLLITGNETTVTPPPLPMPATDSPLALFAHIPDTTDTRAFLVYNDYGAWDLTVPAPVDNPGANPAALLEAGGADWLQIRSTQMPAPEALGLQSLRSEKMRDFFGFDYFDALQSIEAGSPPNSLAVVRTALPVAQIGGVLAAQGYTATVEAGAALYSLREDYGFDIDSPTRVGRMATLNRIALLPSAAGEEATLVIGRATAPVLDALHALSGDQPSLADNALIRAAVATLELPAVAQARTLVSLMIVEGAQLMDPQLILQPGSDAMRAQLEEFAANPLPPAWLTAFATFRSAESTYLTVALVLPSTADAAATAATLVGRMDGYTSTVNDRDFATVWEADSSGGATVNGTPVAWVTMRILDEDLHRPGWMELISRRDLLFLVP